MPLHMVAYSGAVAQNAVLANIPLLTDVLWTNTTSGYLPPKNYKTAALYVRADAATRAQLTAPLLRLPVVPNLTMIDTASDPPNLPPINLWLEGGPIVTALDPVNITVSRAGSGASDCQALQWVTDSSVVPKKLPDQRAIYATGAITRVANAWAQGVLTLSDTLPTGLYEILGMAAFGTNLLAARLIFPDQMERPGVLAQQSAGEYGWDQFRYGNVGSFGRFRNTAMPTLEILGYGANTAQTIVLDVVKIGN